MKPGRASRTSELVCMSRAVAHGRSLPGRFSDPTAAALEQRSAPGSRLVINYHSPSWVRPMIGLVVRAVGEPLRSAFTPLQMRELLARHRLEPQRDQNVHEIMRGLDARLGEQLKRVVHLRLAVGDYE